MIVDYNGYTNIQHIRLEEWRTSPVLAPDGITQISTRNVIVGQGYIATDTQEEFITEVNLAREALSQPGQSLVIYTGDQRVQENLMVNIQGYDDFGGPIPSFTILDVANGYVAVVRFEIEFTSLSTSTPNNPILIHQWKADWEIKPNNLAVYRVNGFIRVNPNYVGTEQTSWSGSRDNRDYPTNYGQGANPDLYRDVILPELPKGFKTTSMKFAVDEGGFQLFYTIVMEQWARILPYPAYDGNANFTWTKSFSEQQFIGTKRAQVELEADATVAPSELLSACFQVASAFISFKGTTGPESDLITRIEVGQPNAFRENKITLDMEAIAIGSTKRQALQQEAEDDSGGNDGLLSSRLTLVEIGERLERQWGSADSQQTLNPYTVVTGSATADQLIYVMRDKAMQWDPARSDSALPISDVTVSQKRPVLQTFIVPQAEFDRFSNPLGQDGGVSPSDKNSNPDGLYISVTSHDKVEVLDTGMRVVHSRALTGSSVVFQTNKPSVFVSSSLIAVRVGKPPPRDLLDLPYGAVVVNERYFVSSGMVDAYQKRVYTAYYYRTIKMQDLAAATGYRSQPTGIPLVSDQGGGGDPDDGAGGIAAADDYGLVRVWWPPQGFISFPADPRVEDSAQGRTVFSNGADVEENPDLPYYLGPRPISQYLRGALGSEQE